MQKRALLAAAFTMILTSGSARADFEAWSVTVEDDPFSGGQKVMVDYLSSIRSGIFISCDSAEPGIRVRAIPGWAYIPELKDVKPVMEFAFDGKKLSSIVGTTGSVGDNLAAAEATIAGDDSLAFVEAFATAKKQVAVKDGISDAPQLLKARGSTKAGKSLKDCMTKQKKG